MLPLLRHNPAILLYSGPSTILLNIQKPIALPLAMHLFRTLVNRELQMVTFTTKNLQHLNRPGNQSLQQLPQSLSRKTARSRRIVQ